MCIVISPISLYSVRFILCYHCISLTRVSSESASSFHLSFLGVKFIIPYFSVCDSSSYLSYLCVRFIIRTGDFTFSGWKCQVSIPGEGMVNFQTGQLL